MTESSAYKETATALSDDNRNKAASWLFISILADIDFQYGPKLTAANHADKIKEYGNTYHKVMQHGDFSKENLTNLLLNNNPKEIAQFINQRIYDNKESCFFKLVTGDHQKKLIVWSQFFASITNITNMPDAVLQQALLASELGQLILPGKSAPDDSLTLPYVEHNWHQYSAIDNTNLFVAGMFDNNLVEGSREYHYLQSAFDNKVQVILTVGEQIVNFKKSNYGTGKTIQVEPKNTLSSYNNDNVKCVDGYKKEDNVFIDISDGTTHRPLVFYALPDFQGEIAINVLAKLWTLSRAFKICLQTGNPANDNLALVAITLILSLVDKCMTGQITPDQLIEKVNEEYLAHFGNKLFLAGKSDNIRQVLTNVVPGIAQRIYGEKCYIELSDKFKKTERLNSSDKLNAGRRDLSAPVSGAKGLERLAKKFNKLISYLKSRINNKDTSLGQKEQAIIAVLNQILPKFDMNPIAAFPQSNGGDKKAHKEQVMSWLNNLPKFDFNNGVDNLTHKVLFDVYHLLEALHQAPWIWEKRGRELVNVKTPDSIKSIHAVQNACSALIYYAPDATLAVNNISSSDEDDDVDQSQHTSGLNESSHHNSDRDGGESHYASASLLLAKAKKSVADDNNSNKDNSDDAANSEPKIIPALPPRRGGRGGIPIQPGTAANMSTNSTVFPSRPNSPGRDKPNSQYATPTPEQMKKEIHFSKESGTTVTSIDDSSDSTAPSSRCSGSDNSK